ncbi:MAG: lytic transglycosylase domain-containing protein [bacterium]|nr:lytic transglycosylase domain-containing protein [bacterium]
MKSSKIYISIGVMMFVMLAGLAMTVLNLSAQKKENLDTISNLNRTVTQLKKDITTYKTKNAETEQKVAIYKYKENVLKSKYPRFSDVAEIVYRKSKAYNFSPYLIMSLIQVESNFDPYAVSSAGAYGLMQINYSVWKNEMGIDFSRIFKKEYNIDLGLKILKHYYDKASGNMFMALYRYNNGYKYNNTGYNGKIISTRFYSHKKKTSKDPVPVKDVSI